MARFCLSVRPSVHPFVRPSVRRFANAQPGCPVSADDRSHHRVLTAGPAIGGGNRLCGIISPKCDGLGGGKGVAGCRARIPFPIIAYDTTLAEPRTTASHSLRFSRLVEE